MRLYVRPDHGTLGDGSCPHYLERRMKMIVVKSIVSTFDVLFALFAATAMIKEKGSGTGKVAGFFVLLVVVNLVLLWV